MKRKKTPTVHLGLDTDAAIKNWPSRFVARDEVSLFFSGAITNTQMVVLEIWSGLEYDEHLPREIQEKESFRPVRANHRGRDGWTADSLARFVSQHPDWIGQTRALADKHDAKWGRL